MANSRRTRNRKPLTTPLFEKRLKLGLDDRKGFNHEPILVKDSCSVKEQITKRMGDAHPVPEKSISYVVANNLRYWMEQAEMSQTALAAKAGVSQKTISNYLNPEQRSESSSGKMPSPKLEELDKIARALSVPVWHLVREMSEKERRLYEHIEKAYSELTAPDAVAATAKLKPATTRRSKGWIDDVQKEDRDEGHDVRRVQDEEHAGVTGARRRASPKR